MTIQQHSYIRIGNRGYKTIKLELILWVNSQYRQLDDTLIFEVYDAGYYIFIRISQGMNLRPFNSLFTQLALRNSEVTGYTRINTEDASKAGIQAQRGMLYIKEFKHKFGESCCLLADGDIVFIRENGAIAFTTFSSLYEEPEPDFSSMKLTFTYLGDQAFVYSKLKKRFNITAGMFIPLFFAHVFIKPYLHFDLNILLIPLLPLYLYYDYTLLYAHVFYKRFLCISALIILTYLTTDDMISHSFIWACSPLIFLLIHKLLKVGFNRIMKRNPIMRYGNAWAPTAADGLYQFLLAGLSISIPILLIYFI